MSQILALRRIVEEIKNNNLIAALVFIDFKKAFDTVHRGKMLDILRAYGVPEKIVAVIGHNILTNQVTCYFSLTFSFMSGSNNG